jgi:hypothetical protein
MEGHGRGRFPPPLNTKLVNTGGLGEDMSCYKPLRRQTYFHLKLRRSKFQPLSLPNSSNAPRITHILETFSQGFNQSGVIILYHRFPDTGTREERGVNSLEALGHPSGCLRSPLLEPGLWQEQTMYRQTQTLTMNLQLQDRRSIEIFPIGRTRFTRKNRTRNNRCSLHSQNYHDPKQTTGLPLKDMNFLNGGDAA